MPTLGRYQCIFETETLVFVGQVLESLCTYYYLLKNTR